MNINKNAVHKAGLVIAGLSIGGGAGYILAKKKYLSMAEEEIESVKETFQRRLGESIADEEPLQEFMATDIPVTKPVKAVSVEDYNDYQKKVVEGEGIGDVVRELEYDTDEELEVEVNLPGFTVDVEIKQEHDIAKEDRDPTKPYLITETEYMEDRGDFDKTDLTYYEEDDTLATSDDSIIREIERTVGVKNLTRWGQGNESTDTVFVRNERISTDFEIQKLENSYSEIVLGIHKWDADEVEKPVKVKKMRDE